MLNAVANRLIPFASPLRLSAQSQARWESHDLFLRMKSPGKHVDRSRPFHRVPPYLWIRMQEYHRRLDGPMSELERHDGDRSALPQQVHGRLVPPISCTR